MDPSKFQQSDPRSAAAGHELSDVRVRGILIFGVFLVIACILIQIGLWVGMRVMNKRDSATDPIQSPLAERRMAPEGPALEQQPGADLARLRAAQKSELESYGWVDRPAGIVRIPIRHAMRMVADEAKTAANGAGKELPPPSDKPIVPAVLPEAQPALEDVQVEPPAGEPSVEASPENPNS